MEELFFSLVHNCHISIFSWVGWPISVSESQIVFFYILHPRQLLAGANAICLHVKSIFLHITHCMTFATHSCFFHIIFALVCFIYYSCVLPFLHWRGIMFFHSLVFHVVKSRIFHPWYILTELLQHLLMTFVETDCKWSESGIGKSQMLFRAAGARKLWRATTTYILKTNKSRQLFCFIFLSFLHYTYLPVTFYFLENLMRRTKLKCQDLKLQETIFIKSKQHSLCQQKNWFCELNKIFVW